MGTDQALKVEWVRVTVRVTGDLNYSVTLTTAAIFIAVTESHARKEAKTRGSVRSLYPGAQCPNANPNPNPTLTLIPSPRHELTRTVTVIFVHCSGIGNGVLSQEVTRVVHAYYTPPHV